MKTINFKLAIGMAMGALFMNASCSGDSEDSIIEEQATKQVMYLDLKVKVDSETRVGISQEEGKVGFKIQDWQEGDCVNVYGLKTNNCWVVEYFEFKNGKFSCEIETPFVTNSTLVVYTGSAYPDTGNAMFISKEISVANGSTDLALFGSTTYTGGNSISATLSNPGYALVCIINNTNRYQRFIPKFGSDNKMAEGLNYNYVTGKIVPRKTQYSERADIDLPNTGDICYVPFYAGSDASLQMSLWKDDNSSTPFKAAKTLTPGYVYKVMCEPIQGSMSTTSETAKVMWYQLWAGGTRFAVKNYGVSSPTQLGTPLTHQELNNLGQFWGQYFSNTPNYYDLKDCLLNPEIVAHTYCKVSGVYGIKFNGIQQGYAGKSVFFPVSSTDSQNCDEYYWSENGATDATSFALHFHHVDGACHCEWEVVDNTQKCYVRPVLNVNAPLE